MMGDADERSSSNHCNPRLVTALSVTHAQHAGEAAAASQRQGEPLCSQTSSAVRHQSLGRWQCHVLVKV